MTEQLTDQSAFEIAARHILSQGERSTLCPDAPDGVCAYRSPEGLKCAIGVLIPDDEYSCCLEGSGVWSLSEAGLLPASLRGLSVNLLGDLQTIHDVYNVSMWSAFLRALAWKYGLEMPGFLLEEGEDGLVAP